MMAATMTRPLSPASAPIMPIGRLLRAYLLAAKYETLAALRNPGMAIPFLALPPAIYLLFGVVIIGSAEGTGDGEFGPEIVNYLFAGFCTMGAMMPGIFGGSMIALERENGLLKLKHLL